MSLLKYISYQYGIQICKCTSIKDIYKIETTGHGSWCLKRYHVPLDEVEFIIAVQNHLIQNGFLNSPRILLTRFDMPYIQDGETYYMLTNWIDGNNPQFREQIQLKKSVRTLAHFHRHAKYLTIPVIPKRRMRVFCLEKRLRSGLHLVETEFQAESAKYLAVRELIGKALLQLENANVQQAMNHEARVKAFIHGDFNYPNLVVDRQNGAHQLIDFDNTACHIRMEDLAHIIHRNYPWQADGALHLVEIYDRVRPIRNEEFHLLITLLHEPYPFLRAIKLKKRHPKLANPDLPSEDKIKRYSRQLYMQM